MIVDPRFDYERVVKLSVNQSVSWCCQLVVGKEVILGVNGVYTLGGAYAGVCMGCTPDMGSMFSCFWV